MTNTTDTELTVTVENPHPEPEEEKAVVETTDDDTVSEEAGDGARPIIPAPANLAPTPPASTEAAPVLPQPRTGSLDLTEPILDILTNPTV